MKKYFNLDLDKIINGDSPEAKVLYRELGWLSALQKTEEVYDDTHQNNLLLFFGVLTLAWLSFLCINEALWNFVERVLLIYGFILPFTHHEPSQNLSRNGPS